jgi:hypothetical protein
MGSLPAGSRREKLAREGRLTCARPPADLTLAIAASKSGKKRTSCDTGRPCPPCVAEIAETEPRESLKS